MVTVTMAPAGKILCAGDSSRAARVMFEWLEQAARHCSSRTDVVGDVCVALLPSDSHPHAPAVGEWVDLLTAFTSVGWTVRELKAGEQEDPDQLVGHLLSAFRHSGRYAGYLHLDPLAVTNGALVVVDSFGALWATPEPDAPYALETVVLLEGPVGAATLKRAFEARLRAARMLLEITSQQHVDWERLTHDVELPVGDRFQMRELFTTLTSPLQVVEMEYRRAGYEGDMLRRLLDLHRGRVKALHDQVPRYRFMNIAHRSTVERYLATGFRDRAGIRVEPALVRMHVEREIEWLTHYPNYQVGLVEEYPPLAFMLKGSRVLFEHLAPSPDETAPATELMIQSEVLVARFREYFERHWRSIPPTRRRKPDIINYLRARLAESSYLQA